MTSQKSLNLLGFDVLWSFESEEALSENGIDYGIEMIAACLSELCYMVGPIDNGVRDSLYELGLNTIEFARKRWNLMDAQLLEFAKILHEETGVGTHYDGIAIDEDTFEERHRVNYYSGVFRDGVLTRALDWLTQRGYIVHKVMATRDWLDTENQNRLMVSFWITHQRDSIKDLYAEAERLNRVPPGNSAEFIDWCRNHAERTSNPEIQEQWHKLAEAVQRWTQENE